MTILWDILTSEMSHKSGIFQLLTTLLNARLLVRLNLSEMLAEPCPLGYFLEAQADVIPAVGVRSNGCDYVDTADMRVDRRAVRKARKALYADNLIPDLEHQASL
jgi:hypothetical protein